MTANSGVAPQHVLDSKAPGGQKGTDNRCVYAYPGTEDIYESLRNSRNSGTVCFHGRSTGHSERAAPEATAPDAVQPQLTIEKVGLMSSEGSEQMLGLLKELSVYKVMDDDYADGAKSEAETEAYKERQRRRQEIRQEMQELATESKGDPS